MTAAPQAQNYPLTDEQAAVARTELTTALSRWAEYLAERPYDAGIPTRRIAIIREILAVLPPARARRRPARFASACCDLHGPHCEPPSELCCHDCTEVTHDTFPIRHADGSACALTGQP